MAIRDFGRQIKNGGVGLFYYAGHGVQVRGRNFLVPVGTDIQEEDEVEFECIDAGLVLGKMESARNRVNIVILDACRNNPFARSFREKFPQSRYLSTIAELRGTHAVDLVGDLIAAGDYPAARREVAEIAGDETLQASTRELLLMTAVSALSEAGQYDAALEELDRYLELFPRGTYLQSTVIQALSSLFSAAEYERLIAAADHLLDEYELAEGIDQFLLRSKAQALYSAERYAETVQIAERFLKSYPGVDDGTVESLRDNARKRAGTEN